MTIGFTPFNYNPVPEDDFWLSINEDLEITCIQWGFNSIKNY